jgi:hypothetical protein
LFSYTPVPSEHLKWGEVLAIKTFGALLKDIRSPRHHYFASWRAPDPEGFGRAGEDKPPRQSNLIPSDRGRMISG